MKSVNHELFHIFKELLAHLFVFLRNSNVEIFQKTFFGQIFFSGFVAFITLFHLSAGYLLKLMMRLCCVTKILEHFQH